MNLGEFMADSKAIHDLADHLEIAIHEKGIRRVLTVLTDLCYTQRDRARDKGSPHAERWQRVCSLLYKVRQAADDDEETNGSVLGKPARVQATGAGG